MGDGNHSRWSGCANRGGTSFSGSARKPNRKRARNVDDENVAETLEMPDRISDLPDSLLLQILFLLPVSDLIRTGTLSKRWQYLWNFSPRLVFDLHRQVPKLSQNEWFIAVNRTIFQSRVSKIYKLSINFPYNTKYVSDVDLWIRFATRNNVEDLVLEFLHFSIGCNGNYSLPQHIYTNSSLKSLELAGCVAVPRGVISWSSLKRLRIYKLELRNNVIERMLSGCPALEVLELGCYSGFNCLKVNSLSLKEFVLDGWVDEDGECDDDLSFDMYHGETSEDYDNNINMLQELLGKLGHVPEIKLQTWCIQGLSILELRGLPAPPLNCKCFTLDIKIVRGDLPGIAKLLDVAPYLETLVLSTEKFTIHPELISGAFLDEYDYGENYFASRKRIPNCLLQHLKIVKILGLGKTLYLFELVRFLLKNARVLEKMVISLENERPKCTSERSTAEILIEDQDLLTLPRSSPHAEVMFSESH